MNNTEMKEMLGLEVIRRNDRLYVAHCDRTKGITLKNIHTDEEAFCVNRAEILSSLRRFSDRNRTYHLRFSQVVKEILSGRILTFGVYDEYSGFSTRDISDMSSHPSFVGCAFR